MRIPHGLRAASGGGGGGGEWDLSNAVFNGSPFPFFSVVTQETAPEALFFKPDGTKVYVLGASGDDVNEYDLSTAWDLSGVTYVQNLSVNSQDTSPRGLFFKSDGTKMYVVGSTGDDVNEYSLSTAWDISTTSYVRVFSVSSQEATPEGLFFKPDGTKMYVVGSTGDNVNEYDLSTAWDISTASYVQNFSVGSQETTPKDLSFKPDGTKMYVVGSSGDNVNEYNLSTAWDISTASYVQNFSVSSQDSLVSGLYFKPDGTRMYIIGNNSDRIWQYLLSTPWDISTAAVAYPTSNFFFVGTQETSPSDVQFKPDGTKMYIIGFDSESVHEYDLSTPWSISTASYLQSSSVSFQETTAMALFFKPDGTKMYVSGQVGDDVNEYSLSTAWDISTKGFVRTFSVATQETSPSGLFFHPDGTKMYVLGSIGDNVYEYSLSTAWNVSTASYVRLFSVAAQDTSPQGLFFKPDGTKMYVVGRITDTVYEYDLSTAWNVSTASYLQSFYVSTQETLPLGVFFEPNGTKMYICGESSRAVWSYDL